MKIVGEWLIGNLQFLQHWKGRLKASQIECRMGGNYSRLGGIWTNVEKVENAKRTWRNRRVLSLSWSEIALECGFRTDPGLWDSVQWLGRYGRNGKKSDLRENGEYLKNGWTKWANSSLKRKRWKMRTRWDRNRADRCRNEGELRRPTRGNCSRKKFFVIWARAVGFWAMGFRV